MESQGYGQTAPAAGYTSTHPELYSTNPNMAGAAPEKRGIADKVKGMLGGHGQRTDAGNNQPGVYGDATSATGTAESTRVGCLDKLKAKTGIGHGLAPAQTRAQGGGLTGHHTGGGGAYTDLSGSPDFNGGTDVNSSAAVHGGWPHPINPNESVGMGGMGGMSGYHNRETHNRPTGLPNPFSQANPNASYGGGQPTNLTGVTNAQGGAVLGDHQGNVYEGPRDDNEKKEGFVSKIMDKQHSPKGQPANTTTGTTPSTY